MLTCKALSSRGEVEFDVGTGEVLRNTTIYDITQIDVAEWCKTHNTNTFLNTVDILDLGYWHNIPTKDTLCGFQSVYEPPDYEWRKMMQENPNLTLIARS